MSRRYIAVGSLAAIALPLSGHVLAQPDCFDSPDRYVLEQRAESMAQGDLNGDLAPDLALLGFDCLDLFFNNGNGRFPIRTTITDGLALPLGVVIADFDGDLVPDLLVANRIGTEASFYRNTGGAQFAPPQSIEVNIGQELVAVGDLDGDMDQDLVFGAGNPQAGDIVILLNNGDATFSAPTFLDAVDDEYMDVAIGDLDGDNDADIVAVSGEYRCDGQGVISVLENRGDGTFEPAVRYPSPNSGFRAVALADLNGDLSLDVVASATCDFVCVFPNQGDGTLGPSACYAFAVDSRSRDVVVGDFDDDNDPDVAVGTGGYVIDSRFNGVSLLFNQGDGTLGDRDNSSINVSLAMTSGDLDADGDDDLAVSTTAYYFSYDSDLAVLFNMCGGGSGPTLSIEGSCPGPLDFVMTDLSPGGFVDLVFSFSQGAAEVPLGPCVGTALNLGAPLRYAGSAAIDANGMAVLSVNAPRVVCNASFIQAVDRVTCATSNVAPL